MFHNKYSLAPPALQVDLHNEPVFVRCDDAVVIPLATAGQFLQCVVPLLSNRADPCEGRARISQRFVHGTAHIDVEFVAEFPERVKRFGRDIAQFLGAVPAVDPPGIGIGKNLGGLRNFFVPGSTSW